MKMVASITDGMKELTVENIQRPVKIEIATNSGQVKIHNGNVLQYKKGDAIATEGENSWVIAKDIFAKTYEKIGPDTYQKKKVRLKCHLADKSGTVKTLEGPVTFNAGDYIMTGVNGEQYPIPPTRFKQLYKIKASIMKLEVTAKGGRAKETLNSLVTKWKASNRETKALETDIKQFCKDNDLKMPSLK